MKEKERIGGGLFGAKLKFYDGLRDGLIKAVQHV